MIQAIRTFFSSSTNTRFSVYGFLLRKLFLVLLLYIITRLLLFVFHRELFPNVHAGKLLYFTFVGIRFDLIAWAMANALYVLLVLLPIAALRKESAQRKLNILFWVTNMVFLLPNLIDLAYFPYTARRLNFSIFHYMGMSGDVLRLLPRFLLDFWYLILIWAACGVSIYWMNRRERLRERVGPVRWIPTSVGILITAFIMLTCARGGWQERPLTMLYAAHYADASDFPLICGSTSCILTTVEQKGELDEYTYFDDAEAKKIFSPIHHYTHTDSTGQHLPMRKQNVVLIILESFSTEHVGALNGLPPELGFTPFLDSLSNYSLTFDGWANGKRSIEGIPAITSSLPTWMPTDYITSSYTGSKFQGLASILHDEGYQTAFFHGGANGTMGFDVFCKSAGYASYFGENEYPNANEYDGRWGIWDEPFLQFYAQQMSQMKQPFFTTVFTLSSHHPYEVPKKYAGKFKKGPLEIQQCIGYTDYALREFFDAAKKTNWYNNTLFVITADHTSVSKQEYYENEIGQHHIPILFFKPDGSLAARPKQLVQQSDIVPTVLDYLRYDKPFFAFGQSAFDTTALHFGMMFNNNMWQMVTSDNYYLMWDGTKTVALFDLNKDRLLKTNIVSSSPKNLPQLEREVKAVVQAYSQNMIRNSMTVKK